MAEATPTPKVETTIPTECTTPLAIDSAADQTGTSEIKLEKKELATLIESTLKMDHTLQGHENNEGGNQELYTTLAAIRIEKNCKIYRHRQR